MGIIDNVNRPAPKWFRILKKTISNTTTFVFAVMLIKGYGAESTIMLIIKLSESFLLTQLDTFMANGEVYAPAKDLPYSAPNDATAGKT